jgi:hypothetical protein
MTAVKPPRVEAASPTTATGAGVPASRRGVAIAIGAAVIAAGGLGVFALTRHGDAPEPPPLAKLDAAVVVAPATTLRVDSRPSGATITIDGKRLPGVGPQQVPVAPGVPIHVRVELAGYAPLDNDYTVLAGATLQIDPVLSASPALLHVETTPPGAQVTLAGVPLGDTPLTSRGLTAGKGIDLVLAHAGYETVREKVDLAAGETANVSQVLKEVQKFGYVKIEVKPYAEVWFKGSDLGQNRHLDSGLVPIRLPVGRQQLLLVNQKLNKRKPITVTVVADTTTPVSAAFD